MIARRNVLRLIGLAPIALPVAIKAASAPQPIFGEAILGEAMTFSPLTESHAPPSYADYIKRVRDGVMSINDVRAAEGLDPIGSPSVIEQMREHDLFDDSKESAS